MQNIHCLGSRFYSRLRRCPSCCHSRRESASAFALAFVFLTLTPPAHPQAKYTATGPGPYLAAGASASLVQSDYGERKLAGPALYVDANIHRYLGLEAEVRLLRFHQDADVHESTYLAGPRLILPRRYFTPYIKLLVGRGTFNFPFNYASGSYFVLAPGAGLDLKLGESRFALRADFEYQRWPQFTFAPLSPYGASLGLNYRIRGGLNFANVHAHQH